MVQSESYDLTSKRLARGLTEKTNFDLITLERATHGGWFVILTATLEFYLDDGRTVKVEKKLRLRGAQEGKKPNPNPFGRNNRKARK